MSSSRNVYEEGTTRARVLRGVTFTSSAEVFNNALEDCAPGDPNAVDPRLRERSLREGYQDGYDLGYKEGIEAGRAEIENTKRNITHAVSALQLAANDFRTREIDALREQEQEVLDAVFELAHVILQREVSIDNESAREAVRRALAMAPNGNEATAYMHPDDAGQLETPQIEVDGRLVRIIPNAQIEKGGCVLEIGPSQIDSQIRTALSRVREALQ